MNKKPARAAELAARAAREATAEWAARAAAARDAQYAAEWAARVADYE